MSTLDSRFLGLVCSTSKVKNRHLVEKDFYLHSLLSEMAKNEYLQSKLLFKGGTCLIKAYVPYYRFSEDIDFGWQDPSIWMDKSKKRVEMDCLVEIKKVLGELESVAGLLDLGFNPRIDEKEGVFISNSGTKVTLHFFYPSNTPGITGKLKMEINLQDLLKYPIRKDVTLRSFIGPFEDKMGRAFFEEEYERYRTPISMSCYSPQELMAEKGRAILTRIDYKLRDTLDIIMLSRSLDMDLYDYESVIKEKTRFTVDRFERYMDSFLDKKIPAVDELADSEFNLIIGKRPTGLRESVAQINRHMGQLREELLMEYRR